MQFGPIPYKDLAAEAVVVQRIFTGRAAGLTVREICRQLNAAQVASPTGKATWAHSTLSRLLRNEAYIGRVYFNRTETVPDPRPTRRTRQVTRSRDEWIPIDCPRIVTDETFEAAGRVAHNNTKWSPRRAEPGAWHRYYYCRNHDPLRAGGQELRCPERPTGRRRHRPARPDATTTPAATADRRRARHRLARPDPPAHSPRPARRRQHPTRTEPSNASAGRTTTRVKPRPFAFPWW